jgi:transcriptional regulator with XRE-family HTH domain
MSNTTRVGIVRGQLLRDLRKSKGEAWTLREVAAKAFISFNFLSEVELGRKQPSDNVLDVLLPVLDLTNEEFYALLSQRLRSN